MKIIDWENDGLVLIDQRFLPLEENYFYAQTIQDCHYAIKEMIVRGAPCIGFAGIFGLALWAKDSKESFEQACTYLKSARPTAVNLQHEIDRCYHSYAGLEKTLLKDELIKDAFAQIEKLKRDNTKMAEMALKEFSPTSKLTFMTHCNTGRLACGTIGTALGVIEKFHEANRLKKVFVDETRPYMQGSRLTAFELAKLGVDFEVVVEGASSFLFKNHKVDGIFVGADRIAANGDTANKIGTSNLAMIAKYFDIPFYVVAPLSSFDFTLQSGNEIHVEMRPAEEILSFKGDRIAPKGARALNPSFDITDHTFITGIICEKGIVKRPNLENMKGLSDGRA